MSFLQTIRLRLVRRLQAAWRDQQIALVRHQLAACGQNTTFHWPLVINGADHVRIGSRVCLNAFVHIWGQGGVEIGDDTLIASHVAITSLTHTPGADPHASTYVAKPVKIGRNVWIGAHAVILPGITIGDHAVIGAGAVVTRDIPASARVVGVPAREMKN